jgi:hypothetical protein
VVWGQVRTQVPLLWSLGKKTAADLVLTDPVELGYVQARRATASAAAQSWKSMLSVPDLAASSTAVRQAWSITHGSLSLSLSAPPPPSSRYNMAAEADLQCCQISRASHVLHFTYSRVMFWPPCSSL